MPLWCKVTKNGEENIICHCSFTQQIQFLIYCINFQMKDTSPSSPKWPDVVSMQSQSTENPKMSFISNGLLRNILLKKKNSFFGIMAVSKEACR